MMEVGPWRVDGQGGLKMITGGWDEYANIVFGVFRAARAARSLHSTRAYILQMRSRPASGYWPLLRKHRSVPY